MLSIVCNKYIVGSLVDKIKYDLEVAMSDDNHADLHFTLDHRYCSLTISQMLMVCSHAADLMINSLERNVRTRLYFTSESHLHTLLNILRYPCDEIELIPKDGVVMLDALSELSYMTQIVIRLFESVIDGESNYRCEISFSPGAIADPITDKTSSLYPYVILNKFIPGKDLIRVLYDANAKLNTVPFMIPPEQHLVCHDANADGFHLQRIIETVVLSNNTYDTPDTWEEIDSPARVVGRRIVSRRSVSATKINVPKLSSDIPSQKSLNSLDDLPLTLQANKGIEKVT